MASQVKPGSVAGQAATPARASSERPHGPAAESSAGRPRLSQSSRVTARASAAVSASRWLSRNRSPNSRSPLSTASVNRRSSSAPAARDG